MARARGRRGRGVCVACTARRESVVPRASLRVRSCPVGWLRVRGRRRPPSRPVGPRPHRPLAHPRASMWPARRVRCVGAPPDDCSGAAALRRADGAVAGARCTVERPGLGLAQRAMLAASRLVWPSHGIVVPEALAGLIDGPPRPSALSPACPAWLCPACGHGGGVGSSVSPAGPASRISACSYRVPLSPSPPSVRR